MTGSPLRFIVFGLTITSARGNVHAATYRGLLRELARLGHSVLFLERDVPWFAVHRDLPDPDFCRTELYSNARDAMRRFAGAVRDADVVVIGSCVVEGVSIGEWAVRTARGVTAFLDLDAPLTLARLDRGDHAYISPNLVPQYQLYLSSTGGRLIERLEREYGSPAARPFYACVDRSEYHSEAAEIEWDLGYMGEYSADRQATVDRLVTDSARRWGGGRFIVAGSRYPSRVYWPSNVLRVEHVPRAAHREFYSRQRFTVNVSRAPILNAGWSPSARLFEAAACGTPVISDVWEGLAELFEPDREILLPRSSREVLELLVDLSERERQTIGRRARARVLRQHTTSHRVRELLMHLGATRSVVPAA